MSSPLSLPPNSALLHPSLCCQHLQPLLDKIDQLESRLQLETDRRENEYNQLLKMYITGRKGEERDAQNRGSQLDIVSRKSKIARKMTSPSARKPILKVGTANKKSILKTEGQCTTPDEKNADLIFHNENVRKQLPPPGKSVTPSQFQLVSRLAVVEDGLQKQQNELAKIKELNDYLMEQLLGLFEKTKGLEQLSQTVKRNMHSEQTITSMVMDNDSHHEHIKIVNKQFSSSRSGKSDLSKADLGDLAARVSEHEGMLSDLIQLTKHLSGQIQQMPSQWGTRSTH